MRHRKDRDVFVRSASTELSLAEHQALKEHAQRKCTTIQKILRDLVLPLVTPKGQKKSAAKHH
jgi:hypothetical protein